MRCLVSTPRPAGYGAAVPRALCVAATVVLRPRAHTSETPARSSALLDALENYEGALVVVSHDRPFCEALRCTHVAYVADGACTIEERELRDADFSEADRGVTNAAAKDEEEGARAAMSAAQAKVQREEERRLQKLRSAAPKKIVKLEASIAAAEEEVETLDAQMLKDGN